MSLAKSVYQICEKMPKEARFNLADQARRSALSIPSNIAEGHARDSQAEFNRFLSIALGSLAELETQMELAEQLAWCASSDHASIKDKMEKLGRMLRRLQQSVRNRPNQPLATSH